MKPGIRVRIVNAKPLDPAWPPQHVGREGRLVGIWNDGGTSEVPYPVCVEVDGVGRVWYQIDAVEEIPDK